MKDVIVTYTVKPEFAETNAANIRRVMEALRKANDPGIRYEAFRKPDGVTFVHFTRHVDEAAHDRLIALPEFKEFQAALRGGGAATPPSADLLDEVGSSRDPF